MNTTEETRKRWREQAQSDPYGRARMSAVAVLLDDFDELAKQAQELADATGQLLDDMGKDGQSVCLNAKAKARVAYEPFREPDYDPGMSLEDAQEIVRASDQR